MNQTGKERYRPWSISRRLMTKISSKGIFIMSIHGEISQIVPRTTVKTPRRRRKGTRGAMSMFHTILVIFTVPTKRSKIGVTHRVAARVGRR